MIIDSINNQKTNTNKNKGEKLNLLKYIKHYYENDNLFIPCNSKLLLQIPEPSLEDIITRSAEVLNVEIQLA